MVLRDMSMETARFSPRNQHPVFAEPPPDTTQTIFLEHPFERLSPTLAASPRVVEASSTKRESVYPDVRETMQKGFVHRADFFDDGSSESEWEDKMSRIMQSPTASTGPGLRDLPYDINSDHANAQRGRGRYRSTITSLPHLTSLQTYNSNLSADYSGASYDQSPGTVNDRGTSHARKMSLRRLNKDNVRLVDNRSFRSSIDSPRLSLRSTASLPTSPLSLAHPVLFSAPGTLEDTLTALPQSPSFRNTHRRTKSSNSTSDSVVADSIINAHVMTMRALEALTLDPRTSNDMSNAPARTYLYSASTSSWLKSTSFSANRHITLSPLSTDRSDKEDTVTSHRSAKIYSPTPITANAPNPLSVANLNLPKPVFNPLQHSSILYEHLSKLDFSLSRRNTQDYAKLDSACATPFLWSEEGKTTAPWDDRKGKCVLGLVAGRERDDRVQEVVGGCGGGGGVRGGVGEDVKDGVESGVVVCVALRRWTWGTGRRGCTCNDVERGMVEEGGRAGDASDNGGLVQVFIPTTTPSQRSQHSRSNNTGSNTSNEKTTPRHPNPTTQNSAVDFDDKAFALALRSANRELAGCWSRRTFSARTLSSIQIQQKSARYHNDYDENSGDIPTATHGSRPTHRSPHTHQTHPSHSSLTQNPRPPSQKDLIALFQNPETGRKKYTYVTWARHFTSPSSHPSPSPAQPKITLHHTLSTPRILLTMSIALVLSIAAAVSWICLDLQDGGGVQWSQGRKREKVGGGMAIGVFVLAVEGWGVGGWVGFC